MPHRVRLHERRRGVQHVVVVRLGGEVHDQVGARDEGVDEARVGDVALHEGDLTLEGGQRRVVAGGGEGVQDGDLAVGAVRLRLVDEVGADDADSTGDKDALGAVPEGELSTGSQVRFRHRRGGVSYARGTARAWPPMARRPHRTHHETHGR